MIGLDHRIQRWVVTHRVEALDPVFTFLSRIGSLGLVWILLALVATVLWRRPVVLAAVAAGVLSADLLALGLKIVGGRTRPYGANPEPEPLLSTPLDLSLPSGHSATSFAGAALLAAFAPRLAVPLLTLAAAIACSRVYVGVHYPLDIVAGALLGLGVAAVLLWTLRFVRRPAGGVRLRPSLAEARRRSPRAPRRG